MSQPVAAPQPSGSPIGLAADERPSTEALHGKLWHFGDPHSRYRFIRVLGTGHYGVTYLCSSLKSVEFVAIKALDKLHPEYQRDTAVEEILILAAVSEPVSDHPNVVDMHEVWEDASYVFIVMEACLGGELFDMVIERKHFTEADAASITAAVLSVMQHCHSKGIIHRDLKPENFLLLREGELSADNLRAIDFGLSKFVERDGICRSCVGSSYYVAPEVLKGAYSYEADAWSVGTITYILLSGFPPFWGSSDQVIFHRILNKPVDFGYQPWHQISVDAKDFVGRLLDKDASTRMTVSEGLLHPWITKEATDVPLSTEIIKRLQGFTHQNRAKCLLMTVAAHHLNDDEIGGLRKIFHFIDGDHDGEISMHDLTVALQHAGLELAEAGITSLLNGLDLDHHGTVHVEEFIAATLDQRKVLSAKTVNSIFAELDQDHDGLITVRELKEALDECHVSIKADTLERLMEREGALDSKRMVSSQSFSRLLMHGETAEPLELEEWMEDVQQFSAGNSFRQLAMLVVARHMQPGEVERLRQLFQHLDEEATGTITMAQLQETMQHMGKEVGQQELQQLLEALDIRQRGVIEYDEFLAACLEEQHLTETKLRTAFEFFDHDHTGVVTEIDVVQVLKELGMDAAQADELMAAASASSPAGSDGEAPSAPSSRSISFEDFRRMLFQQPPGIITKVLSQPASRSGSAEVCVDGGQHRPQQDAAAAPPPVPAPLPRTPASATLLVKTALQTIQCTASAQDAAVKATAALASLPSAGSANASAAPAAGGTSDRPPRLPATMRVRLTPEEEPYNDYEPYNISDVEESPRVAMDLMTPGPEPPSPIDLMPHQQPPSPIDLRPRQDPRSPFDRQRVGPPSPISLMPRQDPHSPGSGGTTGLLRQPITSPPPRPYVSFGRSGSLGSPMLSLSRQVPTSPLAGGGLGSPRISGGPYSSGATCGMTLQQILQQYSSSGYGYKRGSGSRRGSFDTPREGGGTVNRDSLVSQASDVSESWLGDN